VLGAKDYDEAVHRDNLALVDAAEDRAGAGDSIGAT